PRLSVYYSLQTLQNRLFLSRFADLQASWSVGGRTRPRGLGSAVASFPTIRRLARPGTSLLDSHAQSRPGCDTKGREKDRHRAAAECRPVADEKDRRANPGGRPPQTL